METGPGRGSTKPPASRATCQNLCFTSSDLGFAHCNIALPSDKSLGSLGCEHTPDTLVHGISGGGGTAGQVLAGEGERSMTASSRARIRDSIRRVAEGTAGQTLAGEGERKHDGKGGEDKR